MTDSIVIRTVVTSYCDRFGTFKDRGHILVTVSVVVRTVATSYSDRFGSYKDRGHFLW